MSDSPSHLELFATSLLEEVRVKCAPDNGNPTTLAEAFTAVTLEVLDDHNEVDDWTACAYEARAQGGFPAAKLSAWSMSADGATLDLFISHYFGDEQITSIPKSTAETQFRLVRGFLQRALAGIYTRLEEAHAVFDAAYRIHQAAGTLTTVRLFLLTDAVVKSTDIAEEPIDGLEVRYVLWDLEKLSRLRAGERSIIKLDFVEQYGGPVACLAEDDVTGEYRTFLAFLPALTLAKIYGEFGQRLLERNVRAFLQTKGKINKGLQQTLEDEPHRFLAYNNGLCCTAASVEVDQRENGHALLHSVSDFQIVNGGQTTASIYHAFKREKTDITNVVVQVKLTVLKDPEKVTEIVPLISKYANSQNKVNGADFSANGAFHRDLEELSRTIWAPARSGLERGTHWYYERARGSYLDDKLRQGTPARMRAWERENPSPQKFTKTDLAKFEQCWMGLPHLVCRGAEKNFIQMAQRHENDGEPIVDAAYFQHIASKMMLFKATEKLITKESGGDLRSNTVAYTVAWIAERSNRRVDLDWIWSNQGLPSLLDAAITLVGRRAYAFIKGQPGNPSEATKRLDCWERFKGEDIDLPASWAETWAEHPFLTPCLSLETAGSEWERIRGSFEADSRTLAELAKSLARPTLAGIPNEALSHLATFDWDALSSRPGFGPKRLRQMVELFSTAVGGPKPVPDSLDFGPDEETSNV